MLLDQVSLYIAIALSSAALSLTLVGAWLGARADTFLLSWAVGLSCIVAGLILFHGVGREYHADLLLASFGAVIAGFGFVYAGAMQFRFGAARWSRVLQVGAAALVPAVLAFGFGYSGLGTALANFGIAMLLGVTAAHYWRGRSEARFPMIANATLYAAAGVSFLLCGLVLVLDGQWVIDSLPSNWAEDLNAVVVIVGVSGVGALSLALNQSRMARYHEREAMTDPLTGLLNRRALMRRFTESKVRPRTAAILFDLDHFKSINDSHGHAAGDIVLSRFADVVLANIRVTDIAARVGGEEFCLLIANSSQKAALEIAERIRSELESRPVILATGAVTATVSAGVAFCSSEPEHIDDLLKRADDALYIAKAKGRNRVHDLVVRIAA